MQKKIKEFISKDRYFYGILILFVLFLGQLPIILHILHTPKGFYYPFLDRTSFSDYYYLGVIRFGMGPDWLLKIPYIIYDHQASVIQIFFVMLGKLSLVTGAGPAEMFAVFRVLGGLLYAVSAAVLLKTILGKNQARLAFIFFLFAQPLPALDFFTRIGSDFDVWVWHFGEASRRLSAMPPHYTIGKALAVFSLAFFFRWVKNRDTKYIVPAGLSIFIAGIIYPPPVFIIIFSLAAGIAIFTVLNLLFVHRRKGMKFLGACNSRSADPLSSVHVTSYFRAQMQSSSKFIPFLVLYMIAALLPLLILKHELARGYPWDMWNKVELGWNSASMQFEWGYARMLGVVFFLSLVAVFKIIKSRKTDFFTLIIIAWSFSSFLLFPFAGFLSLGKFRFIEGAQIIPLAVLALWGLEHIAGRSKTAGKIFLFLFICNFAVFAVLQARWATVRLWPYWTNVYFRPQEVAALSYLNGNIPRNAIVAADAFSSNYLPAFARMRTVLGFPDFYPKYMDFQREESDIGEILAGKKAGDAAKDYLTKRRIDYIYYDSPKYGEKVLYPEFLTITFQNNIITLYKVKR